jgi:predicted anti-sigma-YlaC factor YlaD
MTCFSAKRRSGAYVDRRLSADERSRVDRHLRECDECAGHFDRLGSVRSALQQLPIPLAPASLKTRLRIIASWERSYSLESRLQKLWERWKFRIDEFMRPITIPATGGLLSSIALFATLALSIGQTVRAVTYEVPLGSDVRAANLLQVDMSSAVVLTMSLDGSGRIRDYDVRGSADSYTGDPAMLVSNNISLPHIPGVLELTHPISGAVRISLTPLVFRQ